MWLGRISLELLTPWGALLALVVLVPLGAYLAVSKRASQVRRTLGLPDLPESSRVVTLVALLSVGGLLALAAMQPFVERSSRRSVRSDAQAYVVLDVSRSMLARQGLGGAMRIDRAKQAAERLRAALPDVPFGIASLTNRVLPHLFPSADEDAFRSTLEKAVGVERPAPGTGFILAPGRLSNRNATAFSALTGLARNGFFAPAARHRVVVVLTDGESSDVSADRVGRSFRRAGIDAVFVRFWDGRERVYTNGKAEPQYRPQPESRSALALLGAASGGRSFDEADLAETVRTVQSDLGTGPVAAVAAGAGRRLPLAPYAALAAFVPLGLLLYRRNR